MASPDSVLEKVARHGVVPVIAIDSVDAALPLADALLEGGLPVIEITFRTKAAAAVIETLAIHRPTLLVGAGTVLTGENLKAAKASGAGFCVAPGCNPATLCAARDMGMPLVPGVATPSDVEIAMSYGYTLLKFFPAESLGGVGMLRSMAAPYLHMGVRFVPTGGINAANLETYLAFDRVAAVGGTWIATRDDLLKSQWQGILDRCRSAVEIVRRIRG